MTSAIEARLGKSYSPAFSLRPAPESSAAAANREAERTTWAPASVEAISPTPAPGRSTTLVTSPLSAFGPAVR